MRTFLYILKKYFLIACIVIISLVALVVGLFRRGPEDTLATPIIASAFKEGGNSANLDRDIPKDATNSKEADVSDTESAQTSSAPTVEPEEEKTLSFQEVDQSYFEDACFIGDSRIEDFAVAIPELYKTSTLYGRRSLTVYNVLDYQFVDGKYTPAEMLESNQFKKIYLLVGINEAGYGTTEKWIAAYQEIVDRVQKLQPDAMIFLLGNTHIAKEMEGRNGIYNDTITERNNALSELADNQTIFYIEFYEGIDDNDGYMQSNITYDGCHLYSKEYHRMYDIIRTHGIIK